jgi:X-Pro dipeptidyl-peptidase
VKSRCRLSLTALCAIAVMLTSVLPAASAQADRQLHWPGLTTRPILSYEDAVRETVYVESTVDNDEDGAPDRLALDVIRPRLTELGLTVPVILESSPYYATVGRGAENELKTIGADGRPGRFPLFYDNYFVPRGYAVALLDSAGTRNSQGCLDMGGRAEILGAKAVVDWLGGRGRAFRTDGTQVRARWSNGRVGMIGTSWDAAIANGVATTGVAGLRTIVSIAAPSSWYDTHRDGGLPIQPPWPTPVQSFDQLSSRPPSACEGVRQELATVSADITGNYDSQFWAPRDFVTGAGNVKASVFLVHGLNDWNVDPKNVGNWWNALTEANVPRKLWLAQTAHADPFDFRRAAWVSTLHRWFDHWLYDLPNGIMNEPVADLERAPDRWERHRSWPDAAAEPVTLNFGPPADDRPGILTKNEVPAGTQSFTDDPTLREPLLVEDELTTKPYRLAYLSPPLDRPVRISGSSKATLTASVSAADTNFAVKIVDYGADVRVQTGLVFDNGVPAWSEGLNQLSTETCWGATGPYDDPCYREHTKRTAELPYEIVSRGWLDARNRDSLSVETPLVPGQTYQFQVRVQVEDYVFKPGHRIGVIIAGSDPFWVRPDNTLATTTQALEASGIALPVVGGAAAIGF